MKIITTLIILPVLKFTAPKTVTVQTNMNVAAIGYQDTGSFTVSRGSDRPPIVILHHGHIVECKAEVTTTRPRTRFDCACAIAHLWGVYFAARRWALFKMILFCCVILLLFRTAVLQQEGGCTGMLNNCCVLIVLIFLLL